MTKFVTKLYLQFLFGNYWHINRKMV